MPVMKPSHEYLEQLASGYRASQILFTAVRLDLFACLDRKRLSAAELAKVLQVNERALRILCDALTAMRLLTKNQTRYANTALSREFLLPEAARSQISLLRHGARLYERFGRLYDVVRTGRPVPRQEISAGMPEDERMFARAMASSASLGARQTAAAVDLRRVRSLLDVGGGPGVYAIEFARRQPQLKAVVFDSARTLEVARANIEAAGLAHRVSVRAGDAFEDPLGGPYDFILLSNIVHVYSNAANRRLIARAAKALAPGGRLGIKEFVLLPTRTGPEWASLFAVNMLVNTEGGDCYTAAEIKGWLRDAGLRFAGVMRLSPPSQMILGRKGAHR